MNLTREEVLEIIVDEFPRLLGKEPHLRYALVGAMAEAFVTREEIRAVLDEIKALREDFNARFEEHSHRLEEHSIAIRQLTERVEEHSIAIRQLTERVEEHSIAIRQLTERVEEHSHRLEEHSHRLEEHSHRLEELSIAIHQLIEQVKVHSEIIEEHSRELREMRSTLGGLGARWGMMSEEAFREGIANILADVGFTVERFWQMDTEGYVFGRPDQVEIDVAIHDEQVILMEIRSSVSRGDVTIFQRKVEFYEKVKGVKAARRVILSPFFEPGAKDRARAMGIEVYTSAFDVPT